MTPPSASPISPEGPFAHPIEVEELATRPVDRLAALLAGRSAPFLLESTADSAGMGEWHILGANPVGELRAHGTRWDATYDGRRRQGCGNPWDALESWWRSWRTPEAASPADGDPSFPFVGGAVGYLGYELGEHLETFPPRSDPERRLPDLHLYLYDEVVVVQRRTGRTFFLHRRRDGWPSRRWFEDVPRHRARPSEPLEERSRSLSDEAFLAGVARIREGIRRGDVYEVNLCRRHLLRGGPSVWELHRRLRKWQPVPYAALLPWTPVGVVSASPERFLRRCGSHVETRPIKGTAPRGRSREDDARLARGLRASAKERAELAMIIDLERNDLGRVCTPGSIQVVDDAAVELYATVIHTVGTVRGELPPELSPIELLRATFPGGSITGAPKIAAMHAIRALEPAPRKVYTGAIGWISPNGDLDLSVAIRTVLQTEDVTYFSVGGAVTWDSEPEQELAELEAKGRAIFAALRGETVRSGDPEDSI